MRLPVPMPSANPPASSPPWPPPEEAGPHRSGRAQPEDIRLRPARAADAAAIVALSAPFAADDLLIARTPAQIAAAIDEFQLAVAGETVLGCVGMAVRDTGLLVFNLCVSAAAQGAGIGGRLVEGAARIAPGLGCRDLFAVSRHSGAWFLQRGFSAVRRARIPVALLPALHPGRGSTVYRRALEPAPGSAPGARRPAARPPPQARTDPPVRPRHLGSAAARTRGAPRR
ncbi:GNAT family N-acetyltransferase [Kitasatospora sp. NBC_01266]|uniref:GNAT family N-acetyltransferase n=1 Tax=Kitasatospora sp. NBC_01266 TaxID=2903572 RepID=UPI002E33EF90|nr:GNAT family N-acetyltransferase [Kitasatospora sp. NBC_01266]